MAVLALGLVLVLDSAVQVNVLARRALLIAHSLNRTIDVPPPVVEVSTLGAVHVEGSCALHASVVAQVAHLAVAAVLLGVPCSSGGIEVFFIVVVVDAVVAGVVVAPEPVG